MDISNKIYHTRSPQLPKLSAPALLSYIWMLHFAVTFCWNNSEKYLDEIYISLERYSPKYFTPGRPSCKNYLHWRCCLTFECYILLKCLDEIFRWNIYKIFQTRSHQLPKLSAPMLLSYIWMLHFAVTFWWKDIHQNIPHQVALAAQITCTDSAAVLHLGELFWWNIRQKVPEYKTKCKIFYITKKEIVFLQNGV